MYDTPLRHLAAVTALGLQVGSAWVWKVGAEAQLLKTSCFWLLEAPGVTYLVLTATSLDGYLLLPFLGQGKLRHREDKEVRGRLGHELCLPQVWRDQQKRCQIACIALPGREAGSVTEGAFIVRGP